jgi:hypothetical protein
MPQRGINNLQRGYFHTVIDINTIITINIIIISINTITGINTAHKLHRLRDTVILAKNAFEVTTYCGNGKSFASRKEMIQRFFLHGINILRNNAPVNATLQHPAFINTNGAPPIPIRNDAAPMGA